MSKILDEKKVNLIVKLMSVIKTAKDADDQPIVIILAGQHELPNTLYEWRLSNQLVTDICTKHKFYCDEVFCLGSISKFLGICLHKIKTQ